MTPSELCPLTVRPISRSCSGLASSPNRSRTAAASSASVQLNPESLAQDAGQLFLADRHFLPLPPARPDPPVVVEPDSPLLRRHARHPTPPPVGLPLLFRAACVEIFELSRRQRHRIDRREDLGARAAPVHHPPSRVLRIRPHPVRVPVTSLRLLRVEPQRFQ